MDSTHKAKKSDPKKFPNLLDPNVVAKTSLKDLKEICSKLGIDTCDSNKFTDRKKP